MRKTILISIAIISILVLGNGLYAYLNNPTNTRRISVSKFYDSKDGYYLVIPTGDTSTCKWNYLSGNSEMLHNETTEARIAIDKHIIYINDRYNWTVTCDDNLGNHYNGIFPEN